MLGVGALFENWKIGCPDSAFIAQLTFSFSRFITSFGGRHKVKITPKSSLLLVTTAHIALICAAASPAFAQAQATPKAQSQAAPAAPKAAPAASSGLEEIVVTARRTGENLQVVPLAITALTANALEKATVREIRDIAMLTPGLAIAGDGSEAKQQPMIRGLSFTGDSTTESNVAVMLDGIYMANSAAFSLGLMEFQRVEVVKGPQSALYGHSAFGGAINYVTKDPPSQFGGNVQVRGATDDTYAGKVTVGGPVIDGVLSIRGGFNFDHTGGTYKDAVNGKVIGGFEKKDIDFLALYTPNNWSTYKFGFYFGDDVFGLPMAASFPNNCAPNAAGVLIQYCGQLPSGSSLAAGIQASTIQPPGGGTANNRDIKHARLSASYDLDIGKLDVNTGWFQVYDYLFGELFGIRDGVTLPLAGTPAGSVKMQVFSGAAQNNSDYSGEVRLSSKAGGRLNWAFGGYFYQTAQSLFTYIGVNGDAIPAGRSIVCPAATNLACILQTPGGERTKRPGLSVFNNQQQSYFGSLAYDILDQLTVSAEARYTNEYKYGNVIDVVTAPGTDPDGFIGQKAVFRYWNPRFTATYKLTSDNLLYASAAKGSKSGGFNTRAILASELAYNPENNWTYEIGSKNSFFDNKMRVNAAVFISKWTDLQILVPSSSLIGSAVTQNYGAMTAKGGELEVAARVLEDIGVNAGIAYADPKFDAGTYDYSNFALCRSIPTCAPLTITNAPSPRGPVSAVKLEGLVRQYVSKWQYTLGLDIDKPLTGDWRWFGALNYKYETKQFTQVDNLRWIPAKNTLNLNAGVENQKVRASLFVQNALNDLTPTNTSAGQGITRYDTGIQVPKAFLPNQRRIGVTVDYSF